MTENNQEICANCGFTERSHNLVKATKLTGSKIKIEFADKPNKKPCKKFVPKNHSSKEQTKPNVALNFSGDVSSESPETVRCGEDKTAPENKSHSSQTNSANTTLGDGLEGSSSHPANKTPEASLPNKVGATSGVQSHPSQSRSPEKEKDDKSRTMNKMFLNASSGSGVSLSDETNLQEIN